MPGEEAKEFLHAVCKASDSRSSEEKTLAVEPLKAHSSEDM